MRRPFLVGLLAVGTVVGFGSGFAHLRAHRFNCDSGDHWSRRWERDSSMDAERRASDAAARVGTVVAAAAPVSDGTSIAQAQSIGQLQLQAQVQMQAQQLQQAQLSLQLQAQQVASAQGQLTALTEQIALLKARSEK